MPTCTPFLAQGFTLADLAPLILIPVILVGGALAITFALQGLRGFERSAQAALERQLADLQIHETPQDGDVLLTYETFHGVVAWFTTVQHRYALPPDEARVLLRRLLHFNWTWGLFAQGSFIGLPLAVWNYRTQLQSVTNQELGILAAVTPGFSATATNPYAPPRTISPPVTPRRSWVFVTAGWLLMFVTALAALAIPLELAQGRFEKVVPATIGVGLLGWLAYGLLTAEAE